MALCRQDLFYLFPCVSLDSNGLAYSARNLSTRLVLPVPPRFSRQLSSLGRRKHRRVCSSSLRSAASTSSMESHDDAPTPSTFSVCSEEEPDDVIRFKMSDFKVLDHVSIGLGGRV